jgi:hypothetical protein
LLTTKLRRLSDNGLESTTINKKLITIDAKREWYEMEYVISPSQPLATGWFQIVADLPAQWFLNAGTRKIRFSPVSYPMLKLFRACWLTNPNKVVVSFALSEAIELGAAKKMFSIHQKGVPLACERQNKHLYAKAGPEKSFHFDCIGGPDDLQITLTEAFDSHSGKQVKLLDSSVKTASKTLTYSKIGCKDLDLGTFTLDQ